MILGMRLWYGFYGSTLASEGAFEGKMEELCRELGDRGTRAASQLSVKAAATPLQSQRLASKKTLISNDDASRTDFVEHFLRERNSFPSNYSAQSFSTSIQNAGTRRRCPSRQLLAGVFLEPAPLLGRPDGNYQRAHTSHAPKIANSFLDAVYGYE
eukprot:COSAG01_NODE_2466_length_7642_cov_5.268991_2_plen_156_part_00